MKTQNLIFKRKTLTVNNKVFLLIFSCVFSNSLFAQFSLNFESARSLFKKNCELLGSYASSFYSNEGQRDHLLNSIGFRFGIGASDILDFKFGYARLFGDGSILENFNSLSLSTKLSTRRQIFAVVLPFGVHFRSDYELIWYIAPRLLFTIKYKKVFEATLCPNVYIQIDDEDEFWVGCNLGLGVSSNLGVWSIRPEVGLMQTAFDKGIYWNLGISLAYILDFKNKKTN